MNAELSRSRRILRIPGAMILMSAILWIGGAVLQITSPTSMDSWHTIRFNNHGTIHYLSWPVYYLPWLGFGLGLVGVVAFWILCRRIAARLGVSVDTVMGFRRA
jgi:hypothetical protein